MLLTQNSESHGHSHFFLAPNPILTSLQDATVDRGDTTPLQTDFRIEWPKLLWLILCLELCIWNGQFGSFPVFQKVVAARNPSINCRFTVDQMGPAWVWLSAAEMQCSWPSHPRHFQSDHPANNSSIKMYKMDSTN